MDPKYQQAYNQKNITQSYPHPTTTTDPKKEQEIDFNNNITIAEQLDQYEYSNFDMNQEFQKLFKQDQDQQDLEEIQERKTEQIQVMDLLTILFMEKSISFSCLVRQIMLKKNIKLTKSKYKKIMCIKIEKETQKILDILIYFKIVEIIEPPINKIMEKEDQYKLVLKKLPKKILAKLLKNIINQKENKLAESKSKVQRLKVRLENQNKCKVKRNISYPSSIRETRRGMNQKY